MRRALTNGGRVLTPANYGLMDAPTHVPSDWLHIGNGGHGAQAKSRGIVTRLNMSFQTFGLVVAPVAKFRPLNNQKRSVSFEPTGVASLKVGRNG